MGRAVLIVVVVSKAMRARHERGEAAAGLGGRIRALRVGAGLTQQELASRAGVSVASIRDLEQGRVARPHPDHGKSIARILGVSALESPAADEGVPARGLWIGVLGPLVLTGPGAPGAAFTGGQAAVLGLLALAGGSPVHPSSLIDALWTEDPPATASGVIHTYVSRLRGMLKQLSDGPAGPLVTRDRAGYRLNVGADQLDLLAFRRLIADAQPARASGDGSKACELYEQALSLVRGDPLTDVDALRGHPAVIALKEEWATATLNFADLASASGWPGKALPYLEVLAARDQMNEAVQARRMVALSGSGRQADALELYRELHHLLDARLGVQPSQVLRDAHAKVLREDATAPGSHQHGGDRWQRVFQLPPSPADFTSRSAQTTLLTSELSPSIDRTGVPLAVISGMPGVGKTTLALHVAHSMRRQFPDGQLWAHLAGTSPRPRDAGEILAEFLRALGLHGSAIPPDLAERAGCFRSLLAGRRVLVVADDAATAEQVRALLPGTAGCALLVTSRRRLEDLDGALHVPLDVMTPTDAVGMLGRIVGAERIDAEPDAALELVQACGSLPLAVRIAGAKLAVRPSWSISGTVRRINDTQARLGELEAGDLSVSASIAASYGLLPDRHRRAFRLLALLGAADFAAWVVGVLLDEPDAADVVDELEARSILTALGPDTTGEPRYRLHDLLRDFAAERLYEEASEDSPSVLRRLLEAWLQLTAASNAKLPPEPDFPPPSALLIRCPVPADVTRRLTEDPIAWFTVERINLLAAVERGCAEGLLGLARDLAGYQCAFQYLQHRPEDAERNWRVMASYSEDSGDSTEAVIYARLRIAWAMQMRGLSAQAIPIIDDCLRSAAETGDAAAEAHGYFTHGMCMMDLDKFATARSDAERGLAMARVAESERAEFLNHKLLATVLAWMGDTEAAIAAGENALALASRAGAVEWELSALHALAHIYWLGRVNEDAAYTSLRAIELSRRIGDVCGEAISLGHLSDAYRELGWYEEAAGCLLRALPVFANTSKHRFEALCLLKLGYALEAMGYLPEAITRIEQSIMIFRRLQVPPKIAEAQAALDRCQAAQLTRAGASSGTR